MQGIRGSYFAHSSSKSSPSKAPRKRRAAASQQAACLFFACCFKHCKVDPISTGNLAREPRRGHFQQLLGKRHQGEEGLIRGCPLCKHNAGLGGGRSAGCSARRSLPLSSPCRAAPPRPTSRPAPFPAPLRRGSSPATRQDPARPPRNSPAGQCPLPSPAGQESAPATPPPPLHASCLSEQPSAVVGLTRWRTRRQKQPQRRAGLSAGVAAAAQRRSRKRGQSAAFCRLPRSRAKRPLAFQSTPSPFGAIWLPF